MFKRISFPSEALPDIEALVSLSETQLTRLAALLDSKDAVAPVDQSFVEQIQQELGLSVDEADGVVQVCVVLQRLNIPDRDAREVVDDFQELIRKESSDENPLIQAIEAKREALCEIVTRKQSVTREMKIQQIAGGTQPNLESIRTVIHLRPLYKRDGEDSPETIECMVPAMTLEFKYEKDSRQHSGTFNLSPKKLDELIKSLTDAKSKWQILNDEYADKICGSTE